MDVGRELVEAIAELAELHLSEEEVAEQIRSMSNILSLVEQMQALDTSGVAPIANPLDAVQRLRADVVTEADERERFLSIAPETEDGLFLVPKVIP